MSVGIAPHSRTPYLPGPIGRLVRLGLGVALAGLVIGLIELMADGFTGWPDAGGLDLFAGVFLTVWLAPTVWGIGLGRSLGHLWHAVGAAAVGATALIGLVVGEPATGAAYGLLTWVVVTLGWLSVSFVIAAALRTPGCEMRAWRHSAAVVGRDRGRFVACPGPLQPPDEWEARATGWAVPYVQHVDR